VGWGRFFFSRIGLSPDSPTRAAFPLAQFVRHAIRFPAKFHMLHPDAEAPRGLACRKLRPGGALIDCYLWGGFQAGRTPAAGSAREVPAQVSEE